MSCGVRVGDPFPSAARGSVVDFSGIDNGRVTSVTTTVCMKLFDFSKVIPLLLDRDTSLLREPLIPPPPSPPFFLLDISGVLIRFEEF